MEFSDSGFSEEEIYINNPTTFETNEGSILETPQKTNFKKWINSESDLSHISNMINLEISSSTDKDSLNEENNKKIKEEKNKINNKEEIDEDNVSKETKEDSNNTKINYLFTWNEGGNQVKITGSFCDWKIKFDMTKDPNDNIFKCQLPLENKIYQFKFIIDDEWKCSNKYSIKEDNSGNLNNILDLTNYIEKKEETKKKTSEKKVIKIEKENIKETEINKNKIKRKESIYSSQYPSNDSIIPLPLPNKRYYQSFKLDRYSHQNNIGNKKYYEFFQKYSFSDETSSKPIFLLGHINLNHLISSKNKKMINIKNCMSFRFREKACTFIYYK
jgi:hypothetical protein